MRKTRGIAVTATRQVSAKEISSSSLFPRHCPLFLAIQIRGLRIMDPLLMSGVSGLSTLIRAVATGFCCLVSGACYVG